MATVGNIFGRFLGEFWAHLYNFHETVDDTLPLEDPAATEETIPVQMTSAFADASYGDEIEDAGLLYEGVTASPLEDTPVDTTPANKVFDDPVWIIDKDEWTPDWAQAPPKDIADETGETRGQVSNNDWVDEDEPVTDGTFSSPPDFEENAPLSKLLGEVFDDDEPIVEFVTATPTAFPSDETGETTADTSNNDHVDEDEPVTDGSFAWPIEDAPGAAVDDVGPQESGQIYDDDELVTDGSFASPIEETPEDAILGQLLGEVYDDDDPVSEGWFSEPLEETPNDDILGRLLGEVFDDDEPVTNGWFGAPLENAPGANDDINAVSFPVDDDLEDEYPQAYADGFTGSPLEDTPEVAAPTAGKVPPFSKRKIKRLKRRKDRTASPPLDPADDPRGEDDAEAGAAASVSPIRSRRPAALLARALLEPQAEAPKPVVRPVRADLSAFFAAIGEEAAAELERRKQEEEARRLYVETAERVFQEWQDEQLLEAQHMAEEFHVKRRRREIEEERILLMAALEALFGR
jgi:hypothetical protein